MYLNTLSPAIGSKKPKTRAGRGIGSTKGKTAGRGHKGQKSRSGSSKLRGSEGGQMPLQRRVPKFGFTSRKSLVRTEVRISDLSKMSADVIDMITLRAENLIGSKIRDVKVILAGEINRPVTLKGLNCTKGAKAAIEAAGGTVEE